jgi:hypothetical protein
MKKALGILVLLVTLALIGCTSVTPGHLSPVNADIGSKTGEATTTYLFGQIPISGESGIITAARAGGISKVGAIDFKITNYYVVAMVTTIVSGE